MNIRQFVYSTDSDDIIRQATTALGDCASDRHSVQHGAVSTSAPCVSRVTGTGPVGATCKHLSAGTGTSKAVSPLLSQPPGGRRWVVVVVGGKYEAGVLCILPLFIITSGLRLRRSEVLRSLRHYLWAHHRSPVGEKRGKRKRLTICLVKTRKGHRQSDE